MHPIEEYLKTRSVATLSAEHGINVRWSTVNPRKFTANYDQLAAKNGDPIAEACRGTVLLQMSGEPGSGEPGEYVVIAHPFRRFYAFDKPYAAQIDEGAPVTCYDKADGTLAILYFDFTRGRWCVGTRGTPDADIPCLDGKTYAEKFWDRPSPGWDREGGPLRTGWTYCAEITGPDNMHGVAYNEPAVRLLGIFDVYGCEHPLPPEVEAYNTSACRGSGRTLREILAALQTQPGYVAEGAVVVQRDGPPPWAPAQVRRVKVVNPDYHAVQGVMSAAGAPNARAACILNGNARRLLHILPPTIAATFRAEIDAWEAHIDEMNAFIDRLCGSVPTTDRKTAALRVKAAGHGAHIGDILGVWAGEGNEASYRDRITAERNRGIDGGYKPSVCEHVARTIAARLGTPA